MLLLSPLRSVNQARVRDKGERERDGQFVTSGMTPSFSLSLSFQPISYSTDRDSRNIVSERKPT